MTKERFEEILKEEGIEPKSLRDEIWRQRPFDNLDEKRVRKASQTLKKQHPYRVY